MGNAKHNPAFEDLRVAAVIASIPLRRKAAADMNATSVSYGEEWPLDRILVHFLGETGRWPQQVELEWVNEKRREFSREEDAEAFRQCHEHYARLQACDPRQASESLSMRVEWEHLEPYLLDLLAEHGGGGGNLAGVVQHVDTRSPILPSGTYVLKITGHKWKNANSSNLSLQLYPEIVAPAEFAGIKTRPIHLNLVCSNRSVQEFHCATLKAIMEQAGVTALHDASQLHGKLITSQVIPDTHGVTGNPENAHRIIAFPGTAFELKSIAN